MTIFHTKKDFTNGSEYLETFCRFTYIFRLLLLQAQLSMHLISKTAKRLFFLHSRFCISSTGVLGGSCVSRYKSLYSQLTEADHANLQGLASGKCHFHRCP